MSRRPSASTAAGSNADAATLPAWARGRWAIENKLYFVHDVARGESADRTRTGSDPRALAILRNLAVSWLRREGVVNVAPHSPGTPA